MPCSPSTTFYFYFVFFFHSFFRLLHRQLQTPSTTTTTATVCLCVCLIHLSACWCAHHLSFCVNHHLQRQQQQHTHSMAWRKHRTLIVCMCFCSSACAFDGFSGSLELIVTIYSLAAHTHFSLRYQSRISFRLYKTFRWIVHVRSVCEFSVLSTKWWNATLGRFVLMKDVSKAACIPVFSSYESLLCSRRWDTVEQQRRLKFFSPNQT